MEQTKSAAQKGFDACLCGVALGLVGLDLMPALAPAATAPEPSSAVKAEIESNYGKLPLSPHFSQDIGASGLRTGRSCLVRTT
jgi:hypothetical protein